MTTNAFLFMWNCHGIESVVPITKYEEQDKLDTWAILKGEKTGNNPLDKIVQAMTLRARFNSERSYELYAIDTPEGTTTEELLECWDNCPQYMADLTREKGVKLFSNRHDGRAVKIV